MNFSVLIPAFNARSFIEEALDSVASQTLKPREIIVVDDGSNDDTGDAVERWALRRRTEVKLIRQENQGVSVARNRGIATAAGDWIALLDADDVWLPAHLAALKRAIDVCPTANVAFGDAVYFSQGRADSGPVVRESAIAGGDACDVPGFFVLSDRLFEALLPGLFLCPASTAFRRDAAEAIGGFDARIKYIEDRDFFLRLSRRSVFVFVDTVISRARVHDHNITHPKNAARNAYFMVKLLKQIEERAQEFKLNPRELSLTELERQKTIRYFLYASSANGVASYFGAVGTVLKIGEISRSLLNVRVLMRALYYSIVILLTRP